MLAKRAKILKPSPLQEFFRRAQADKDVISLAVGDLNFSTPLPIREAAEATIEKGFTHYTPAAGIPDLRRLAAADFQKSGIETAASENTIIGPGAKPLIAAALWAICGLRDEVLIPGPYYPPYGNLASRFAGGVEIVDTSQDGFELKGRRIQEAISERTKVIILNSPNNPTGMVWDLKEVERIEADGNVLFILDEAYNGIVYNGNYTSFATLPNIKDRAIVIRSCSKTHAMSGWRIGYLTGPEEIVEKIKLYLENAVGCPCSISQKAAVAALAGSLNNPQPLSKMIKMLDSRRKCLMNWLDKRKIPYPVPQGAFYVFADFSHWGLCMDLAEKLLKEAKVAVTPGIAFGPYGNWIRISYAPVSKRQLQTALSRIDKVL